MGHMSFDDYDCQIGRTLSGRVCGSIVLHSLLLRNLHRTQNSSWLHTLRLALNDGVQPFLACLCHVHISRMTLSKW